MNARVFAGTGAIAAVVLGVAVVFPRAQTQAPPQPKPTGPAESYFEPPGGGRGARAGGPATPAAGAPAPAGGAARGAAPGPGAFPGGGGGGVPPVAGADFPAAVVGVEP